LLRTLLGGISALAVGCTSAGGNSGSPDEVAARALDYLETTRDELGVDVLAAAQIYGQLSGDARAERVVAARLPDLRPSDVARYGRILELNKPVLAPRSLDGVTPPQGTPNPWMALEDDRDVRCPEQILSCVVAEGCAEYLMLDGWGYALTHQALWLLLASWASCALPPELDLEARREELAARLLAEARAYPEVGDLFLERLAMLGHLGYASEIAPVWLAALRAAQRPSGCFPVDEHVDCHPHPTGLALWTLGLTLPTERTAD
jgi:hypothetical protein